MGGFAETWNDEIGKTLCMHEKDWWCTDLSQLTEIQTINACSERWFNQLCKHGGGGGGGDRDEN